MDLRFMYDMNWFDLFGLPRCFRLDLEKLEHAYIKKQQIVHPDGWRGIHRESAAQLSMYINKIYDNLKDPVRRAEYMLQYHHAWPVPPSQDILEDVFLLKSKPEHTHQAYQKALDDFYTAMHQADYTKAQHAYLYLCYLKQ